MCLTIYTTILSPVPIAQVGVQTEVEPETALISSLEDKVNAVLPLQNKE
jgi:hypothetical protein